MFARHLRRLPVFLAAAVTLSVPVVLYRFLHEPAIWTAAGGIICFTLIACDAASRGVRIVATGLALAAGVLLTGETVLYLSGRAPAMRTLQHPEYLEFDSLLGVRLRSAETSHAIEWIDDTMVYDVRYGVDSSGHRSTPATTSNGECVAFLVDGFAFGMGVEDNQTLPARVASRAGARLRVLNLGVPGYGAHQALAMLQYGLALPCQPSVLVYQVLAHDVLRVAGYGPWAFTPRYRLEPDGTLRSLGTPRAPATTWQEKVGTRIRDRLELSRCYRWLAEREPHPSERDVRLYLHVMAALRSIAEQQYPGIHLEVLLWQEHGRSPAVAHLGSELDSLGYDVHVVDDILPGYRHEPGLYQLHAHDARPNAEAYDRLAAFVVDSLIPAR